MKMTVGKKQWKVDYAISGISRCQICESYIAKNVLRLGQIVPSDYYDGSSTIWSHATCVMGKAIEIESFDEVEGIESLIWLDLENLRTYINGRVSNESLPFSDHNNAGVYSKLKVQSIALWDLKDNLEKYVSVAELREMLAANDQSTSGPEHVLRDRCADGMMFGALKKCLVCSDHLYYSGSTYKCCGYISKRTSCCFSSSHTERTKGKWKIPKQTDNQWLLKWFKSQKGVKPIRLLLAPSSNVTCGDQTSDECLKSSNDENLEDLKVFMVGLPKEIAEEFRNKVEGAGGQVHSYVKKDTNFFVVAGGLDGKLDTKVEKARIMESVNRLLKNFVTTFPNVETYRAATSESVVNLFEMPPGKLNRSQLQKGIEALSQIEYFLENTVLQPFVKKSSIVDLSNGFFTMIPSKHSHVIRDEDDPKTKVKWLKALVDNDTALRRADFGLQPQGPIEGKSSSHANGRPAGISIKANASGNNCYGGRQDITAMKNDFFVRVNFMYFARP